MSNPENNEQMSPLLEIIVTHYKEDWSECEKLFQMLRLQRLIDFREILVTIIQDGEDGNLNWEELLNGMPYEWRSFTIPHGGISAARNEGIRQARGTWIEFCDCDDTYTHIYTLRDILNVLVTDRYDLLWTPFYAEYKNADGSMSLFPKERDREYFTSVFIHSKIYRLGFIREHKIWFDEELYISEDSYFNKVCEISGARIGKLTADTTYYVWCWRENSTTTDPDNKARNTMGMFYTNVATTREIWKRGSYRDYCGMALRTLADGFIITNRSDLDADLTEFLSDVWAFYQKVKKHITTISRMDADHIFDAAIKDTSYEVDIQLTWDGFWGWIDYLKEKFEKERIVNEERERTETADDSILGCHSEVSADGVQRINSETESLVTDIRNGSDADSE